MAHESRRRSERDRAHISWVDRLEYAIRSRGATPSGRGDGPPGTPTSPGMLVRLGGRQHVLALQRRRFWRELGFATAMLAADALTAAVVFVVLAQLPIPVQSAQLEFLHFLIPSTPQALLRRVASIVF